ncbi:Cys/Met metabolism PLP-dependent enzyme [Rhizoctonia solani]|uniref:cystathionine gamma-lyase n=1 Tax=Rhizoctonia solani TaxID=456999 RepID=A0A8H7I2N0_9AGAM|nr:Cys/Met metabolism PLP-dependent enzyme [Rhizoctonia solani]
MPESYCKINRGPNYDIDISSDPHQPFDRFYFLESEPKLSKSDMANHSAGFDTRAVHVGAECDPGTGAVVSPIYLASTYKQDGVGKNKGYAYTRVDNPNRNQLEKLLASLELGGEAPSHSLQDLLQRQTLYLTRIANEVQGLETTFVDLERSSDEEIIACFRENTKMVWLELPTNPSLRVIDISRIVRLTRAHPSNPLVLIDNTFLSPFYLSPFLLGVDIILHSLTKYVNGHSDVLMGALVFPAEPNHPHATAYARRARFLQVFSGAVPSPHDCWLAHRGAKTMHLRMQAHGRNALKIATYLQSIAGPNSAVESVTYPGLATHPRYEVALRQLSPTAKEYIDNLSPNETSEGIPYGGMITFRLKEA